MASSSKLKASSRIDFASILGLIVGVGGIVGGLIMEGGSVREIVGPTALMIVLGGTLGAVLVTTPLGKLAGAMRGLGKVFLERMEDPGAVIDQIVEYSTKARKNGIVALEKAADEAPDRFLGKALNLAVDGTDLQELRRMMELEIELEDRVAESEARVFESAGGYSPTIGIIGAVLGLIQVMKDLTDISKVGHGIATAFVATIYGVGFANLFFLPAGGKIRARAHQRAQTREMVLEGIIGIVEGLNPKLIRLKLEAYENAGAPEKEVARRTKGAEREKAVEA